MGRPSKPSFTWKQRSTPVRLFLWPCFQFPARRPNNSSWSSTRSTYLLQWSRFHHPTSKRHPNYFEFRRNLVGNNGCGIIKEIYWVKNNNTSKNEKINVGFSNPIQKALEGDFSYRHFSLSFVFLSGCKTRVYWWMVREVDEAVANSGFASGGVHCSVWRFLLYLKFVLRNKFSAKNPARSQSCKTLWASLKTNTVCESHRADHPQWQKIIIKKVETRKPL